MRIEPTLAAVIFDWAGTIIDFGSHAPTGAFVKLFEHHGVTISIDEARKPMGLPKWEHVRALGRQPRIAAAWAETHGCPFTDREVDRLYEELIPMSIAAVKERAALVPGVLELVAALRQRGIRVGTTTGYNRQIMEAVLPLAAAQGFEPDNVVCAGDLPQSRPTPAGMYRCFLDLDVWPAQRVLKVDDTVPGLLEGRYAGSWTAGVTVSGNAIGLTLKTWQALDEAARAQRLSRAGAVLREAEPDFLIPTVAELMPVIDNIEGRMHRGVGPGRLSEDVRLCTAPVTHKSRNGA